MVIIALLFAFQLASATFRNDFCTLSTPAKRAHRTFIDKLKKVTSAGKACVKGSYGGRPYSSIEQELFEVRNLAGSTLASDSQLSLSRFVTLKEAKSYLKEFCFSQLQKTNADIPIRWAHEQWVYKELLSDIEQRQYPLSNNRKLCIQLGLYEAYKEQQHALLKDRYASSPVHHDVFRKTVKEDCLWELLSAYPEFSSEAIDWQDRLILRTYFDVRF